MWPCACTQAGSHSLHMAMCMHTGKKPQFTYGHVHAHGQRATVYMWPCTCTQAGSHILHVVMCMHTGRKPQFTYGHVHAHRHRATVNIWSCTCLGGVYRLTTSRKAKTTAGETVYMSLHRQEKQFTYGHVHAHRQEATVYIWPCACTQAGSHSLHMAMCMHKGKEELEFTCGHVYVKAACTSRQPTEGQRSLQGK